MIKVLIIEDDPMVAEIHKNYIQSFKELTLVNICKNGQDALEILSKKSIDLIILDNYLPKITGLELLKEIRKRNIKSEVIMVTADNEINSLSESLNFGVLDYLIKPFDLERFTAGINKFLSKFRMLSTSNIVTQSDIDKIINTGMSSTNINSKKGLQEQTLIRIRNFMRENNNTLHSSEEIADNLRLSRVTIRRYMNFMIENRELTSEIDYETGGRPSIKYKVI